MKRLATGFLTFVAVSCLAASAFAQGGSLSNAKIALHLQAPTTKNQCTTNGPGALACSNFVVAGDVGISYHMYILVSEGNISSPGIGGVSFGIDYDGAGGSGLDVFGWNVCANQEFPGNGFPDDQGGNVVTWATSTNCQQTIVDGGYQAVVGWMYVYAYSPDAFQITKRNFIPQPDLAVADCTSAETGLSEGAVGFVKFSAGATDQGCNPCNEVCIPTPVESTTWGKLKSTYGAGD